MIYLNCAATALQRPPCVAEAMVAALQNAGSAGRGAHDANLAADRIAFSARAALAALFGVSNPARVVLSANATQALNTVLLGMFGPGDHILATDWDHNSVLRPLYALESRGASVDFVPADRRGNLDYTAFARLLRPNTKGIVVTHASNLTGNLLDLGFVSDFAARHGLPLLLDAAQTAGSFPLQMEQQKIAAVCFAGHKGLMGPQGTGGLCLAPGVSVRPLVTGGTGVRSYERSQPAEYPEHLEAGTLNTPGLAGLAAAVTWVQATGLAAIHAREMALMERFYRQVRAIPEVTVYGDFSGDRAPIVSLNLAGWSSATLADALGRAYDIAVRAGAHCAPRMHRALGTEATGAVRFSFGYFNTEKEIDTAAAALATLAKEPECL